MKKIILIAALLCATVASYAQSTVKFTAVLANTEGRTITKESIMAEPVLLSAPTPSSVSHFEIMLVTKKGVVKGTYKIDGNQLGEEAMKVVKALNSGDKIMINNIKVSSGKEYTAPSIAYTIE